MANHFDRAQWLGASMLAIVAAAVAAPALAQDSVPQAESAPQDDPASTIVVTGFRAALENAVNVKKNAQTIVESVSAEDIGKLPDASIGESIARLPGLTSVSYTHLTLPTKRIV